jgi:hypothetical protein
MDIQQAEKGSGGDGKEYADMHVRCAIGPYAKHSFTDKQSNLSRSSHVFERLSLGEP